ncbi:tRNA (adenine-N(1)-)-methyltransferase catalytic subunit trm61 [Dimargaris cristalligena]|nr:tRNA (adenine-N(1)-)-methyltransferase catalytic subunit trm61 [Dimargaris cristalligena]
MVTIQHRDVCKLGFGLENEVDAVFLDLPAPWEAIPSARTAFRQNLVGKLCSFSPCIEQVQRTCEALSDNGFTDICMFEVLVRNHDIRYAPRPSIKAAMSRYDDQKEARALYLAQKREDAMDTGDSESTPADQADGSDEAQPAKKPKLDPSVESSAAVADSAPKQGTKVNGTAKPSKSDAPSLALRRLTQEEMNYQLVTKTPEECRGHTSYLTFATFIPDLSD